MARIVARWEPLREFMTLRDAMDRLLEDSFVQPNWRALAVHTDGRGWRLPVDVYTTPNEVVITADVAGVRPEDVEIVFEGGTLTIKGEFPAPPQDVEFVMRERCYGPFSRSLSFNVPVDAEHIDATFDNGLLTIVVPKAESIRPKTIKVQAK